MESGQEVLKLGVRRHCDYDDHARQETSAWRTDQIPVIEQHPLLYLSMTVITVSRMSFVDKTCPSVDPFRADRSPTSRVLAHSRITVSLMIN